MLSNGSCMLHLKGMLPSLRPAEQRVAMEVLAHPKEVVHLSITEVAKRANVSDATVVKFSKNVGYKGFQDFKIRLAQDVATRSEPIYGEIVPEDDMHTVKQKIFNANITALGDTLRTLDDQQLTMAAEHVAGARRIEFYGLGASGIVAEDAQHKLSRIGLNAVAYIDSHLQVTMAALLTSQDVAIGISYSGQTWEIVEALRTAKEAGATTICLTSFPQSPLTEHAKYCLLTSSSEAMFRSGAIASRIAQLSAIDALFVGVALLQYDTSLQCIEKTRRAVGNRRVSHSRPK